MGKQGRHPAEERCDKRDKLWTSYQQRISKKKRKKKVFGEELSAGCGGYSGYSGLKWTPFSFRSLKIPFLVGHRSGAGRLKQRPSRPSIPPSFIVLYL